ncbi:Card1-like endonuclease domain-containing protein [Desulfurobacterium sp.]
MILVSPVSTQTFPIIVTALTLKPEKIILLSTPKVRKFESFLKNVLTYSGIEVEVKTIEPYNRKSIISSISGVTGDVLYLLNCGTKYTAMVLFDIAGKDRVIYYTPDGKLLSLDGRVITEIKNDLLDVEIHSAMYGFKIKSEVQEIDRIIERKRLTQYIAFNYRRFISILNKIQNQLLSKNILPSDFYSLALRHQVIRPYGGKYLILDDGYLRGKWFEEFVFLKLVEKGFYDVHIGVVINWYDSDVVNEIDVIAVKNNRLHIFSCKTGKNINAFSKHLYELHELTRRIGGDFAKGYLCIAPAVLATKKPSGKEFPSMPKKPFNREDSEWQKFLTSKEGKEYREAWSAYTSLKFLTKRANLMDLQILTVESLISGDWR